MKRTSRLTRAMLIAASTPILLAPATLAGPDHDHGHKHESADHKPVMDARAKKVWDRGIEASVTKEDFEVESMKMVGSMNMPSQGMEADMTMIMVQDKALRVTVSLPGMGEFVQGMNDGVVWSSNMMEGPKIVEGAEADQLLQQSDLLADLNWEKYYSKVTYIGEETVTFPDGTEYETDKLELTSLDGETTSSRHYDKKTGLNIMVVTEVAIPGGKVPSTTYNEDFRNVEGLMIPFRNIASVGPMQQIIEFTEISINQEIPASEIEMPEEVKELMEE